MRASVATDALVHKVILTAAARADLLAIGRHIAADNPTRAITFVDELLDRCGQLGDTPQAFPLVPRYANRAARRRVHGNYLIFYRIGRGAVEVLHILHGARDYESILFPEE